MRVLAVGCHPDDLEIACSGTLRKYAEQGADVYMCHVANGNLGHVVIEPGPLAEIRTKEAEAAGAIIGAKQVFNLNVGDMRVDSHDQDVIDAMADVVRFVRPDVIMSCGPMPMLRALKAYAAEAGIPCYVSMEERMACGIGVCLGCVCGTEHVDEHSHVNNARICKDGPVFDAKEVTL